MLPSSYAGSIWWKAKAVVDEAYAVAKVVDGVAPIFAEVVDGGGGSAPAAVAASAAAAAPAVAPAAPTPAPAAATPSTAPRYDIALPLNAPILPGGFAWPLGSSSGAAETSKEDASAPTLALASRINKTILKLYGKHLSEDGKAVGEWRRLGGVLFSDSCGVVALVCFSSSPLTFFGSLSLFSPSPSPSPSFQQDYAGIQKSETFLKSFLPATAELRQAPTDVAALSEVQRKCFFINLYNALCIHGNAVYGAPAVGGKGGRPTIAAFFQSVGYEIWWVRVRGWDIELWECGGWQFRTAPLCTSHCIAPGGPGHIPSIATASHRIALHCNATNSD